MAHAGRRRPLQRARSRRRRRPRAWSYQARLLGDEFTAAPMALVAVEHRGRARSTCTDPAASSKTVADAARGNDQARAIDHLRHRVAGRQSRAPPGPRRRCRGWATLLCRACAPPRPGARVRVTLSHVGCPQVADAGRRLARHPGPGANRWPRAHRAPGWSRPGARRAPARRARWRFPGLDRKATPETARPGECNGRCRG